MDDGNCIKGIYRKYQIVGDWNWYIYHKMSDQNYNIFAVYKHMPFQY